MNFVPEFFMVFFANVFVMEVKETPTNEKCWRRTREALEKYLRSSREVREKYSRIT